MGRVEGKVALITGGASGLGAEDARVLVREGARVVITDVQDELGRLVAEEIPGVIYLNHDVRDQQRWREVVAETLKAFGKLDVLVNNAGLVRFGSVEEMSYADYKLQVEVMLDAIFLGCKTVIPHMTKGGGGSIINMGSVGGMKGVGVIPGYAAAKGGAIAITRSIAIYCQDQAYRIRVNSISPGAIETPMTAQALAQLPSSEAGLDQIHQQGMGQPIDIANAVLFLASEESRHITGINLVVDNGETVR